MPLRAGGLEVAPCGDPTDMHSKHRTSSEAKRVAEQRTLSGAQGVFCVLRASSILDDACGSGEAVPNEGAAAGGPASAQH